MREREALQEALEQKEKLRERHKEAAAAAKETTDPTERRRQLGRAKVLWDMYRDACEEVRRLKGDAPTVWKEQSKTVSLDSAAGAAFSSRMLWEDLREMRFNEMDEAVWGDIIQAKEGVKTGRQSKILSGLLEDGLNACTEKQKACIKAYYVDERVMGEIAEASGIDQSVVSRCIKRGLSRIAHHITARLSIARCIDESGKFDYIKFCRESAVLTERQVELLYLMLTQNVTCTAIGGWLGRSKSSVSRSINRAEEKLAAVRVDFIPRSNVTGVKFGDWAAITERELAERLGLSFKFAYTHLYRGMEYQGLPLLKYHALCLMAEGVSPRQAAETLGCSEQYCRKVWRTYGKLSGTVSMDRLPGYLPQKVPRRKVEGGSVLAALRDLTRGTDQIIDRITPEVLARLEKRGTNACT